MGKIEEKIGVQRTIVAAEIVEIGRAGVVIIQFGEPDFRGGMDEKARRRGIGSGAGANIGFRPGDVFLCAQPPGGLADLIGGLLSGNQRLLSIGKLVHLPQGHGDFQQAVTPPGVIGDHPGV